VGKRSGHHAFGTIVDGDTVDRIPNSKVGGAETALVLQSAMAPSPAIENSQTNRRFLHGFDELEAELRESVFPSGEAVNFSKSVRRRHCPVLERALKRSTHFTEESS
jgi:hypothetical protein